MRSKTRLVKDIEKVDVNNNQDGYIAIVTWTANLYIPMTEYLTKPLFPKIIQRVTTSKGLLLRCAHVCTLVSDGFNKYLDS